MKRSDFSAIGTLMMLVGPIWLLFDIISTPSYSGGYGQIDGALRFATTLAFGTPLFVAGAVFTVGGYIIDELRKIASQQSVTAVASDGETIL